MISLSLINENTGQMLFLLDCLMTYQRRIEELFQGGEEELVTSMRVDHHREQLIAIDEIVLPSRY